MTVDQNGRQLLAEISQKLDRVIGLLAIQGRDRDSQMEILSGLGLDSAEIGALMGLSDSTVRGYKFRRKRLVGGKRQ